MAPGVFAKSPRMKTIALLLLASLPVLAADEIVFTCETLDGWQKPGAWQVAGGVKLNETNNNLLVAEPGKGVLVNGPTGRTTDLVTTQEFGDVEVHAEFCISKKSNSGIYFMGRYEVHIYDSLGVTNAPYPGIECGGIYPYRNAERQPMSGHSPRVNVSKAPGEWQSFDVIFRAPRFDSAGHKIADAKFEKVVHNGTVIHENVSVTRATSGGFGGAEKAAGPLRLQGDHGPVAYRNVRIRPL